MFINYMTVLFERTHYREPPVGPIHDVGAKHFTYGDNDCPAVYGCPEYITNLQCLTTQLTVFVFSW